MKNSQNVLSLRDAGAASVELSGGKGASLSRLITHGILVPPGFVITTKAHEKGMDTELEAEIIAAFDNLGVERVAVRSSAVAEDSETASWAGQLDTFLNVTKAQLTEAIQKCWASIGSKHAETYADEHNIAAKQRTVAVVVQAMVDSDISGVLFTANPVTENRDEILIEAVWGLGEMLVQGTVTPESLVVDKSANILNHEPSLQNRKLVYKDGKNQEQDIMPTNRVLSDKLLRALVQLAQQVEAYYKTPQDIEWAISRDKIYIVQSRPITTLKSPEIQNQLPKWDDVEIFRWGPIPGNLFYISDYVEAASTLPLYINTGFPETLLVFNNGQMVWLCDQSEMTQRGIDVFKNYVLKPGSLEAWQSEYKEAVQNLEAFQLYLDDLSELTAEVFFQFKELLVKFWLPTIPAELGNYGSAEVLTKSLERFIPSVAERQQAVQILTAPETLSYNQQEELDLYRSQEISEHQNKYFWLQNNYSGSRELDTTFFAKRKAALGDDIEYSVLEKLKKNKQAKQSLIAKYNLPQEVSHQAEIIWKNIALQDERKKHAALTFHYKAKLLARASQLLNIPASVLENYTIEEVGKYLQTTNSSAKSRNYCGVRIGDGWSMLSDEESEVTWKAYAHEKHKAPTLNNLSGVVASIGSLNPTQAKATIVNDPHINANFPKGNILVAPMTSPDYVILMRLSSGIITDTGGITSHAAIVSRELGLPCVVGTRHATQTIRNGDVVEIDTDNGTVKIIK